MTTKDIDFSKLPGGTLTVGMRADETLYRRLEAVANASRRKIGAVLTICVEDHLPILEKELGITPGKAPKKPTKI